MLRLLPLPLLCLAAAASAYDPLVETRGWEQVAYAEDGECAAEVRGDGKTYYIYAIGLGSGAEGSYYLTNADMKPIEARIIADGDGEFARYYLPFLWHRRGGTVNVTIATDACTLDLAFDWKRGVPVIGPDGERTIVGSEDWPEPLGG